MDEKKMAEEFAKIWKAVGRYEEGVRHGFLDGRHQMS